MVSVLGSGSKDLISSPGQGHCVVFLSKTLFNTVTVPLSTQGKNGNWHICWGGGGGG